MKYVREHINEKFTQDSDPISDMDIGRIVLIKKWLNKYDKNIHNYLITGDLTINARYLEFYEKKIKYLPEYINFFDITESISFYNSGLTSLRGFPVHVGRNVYLGMNNLKTLKGLPINGEKNTINGSLMIFRNNLTSLKGCPLRVNETLNCSHNPLKTLDGMPKYIARDFVCYNTPLEEIYIRKYIKDNNIIVVGKLIINRQIAAAEKYI